MDEGLNPTGRKGFLLHGNEGKKIGYRKVSRALRAVYLFQFMTVEGLALVLGISRQNAFNLAKKLVSKGLIRGYALGDFFCYFLTKDGESLALIEFQNEHSLYEPTEYHGNPSAVRSQSIRERLILPHLIEQVREFMQNEYAQSCGHFESIEVMETCYSLRLKAAACQPDMVLAVKFANGITRNIAVELETTNKTPRELDQKFYRLNQSARRGNASLFSNGMAGFDHVMAFTHLEAKAYEMRQLMGNGVVVWEKRADNQWYPATKTARVRIPFEECQPGEVREPCLESGVDRHGDPLEVWVTRQLPSRRELDKNVFLGVWMFEFGPYGSLPKVP